MTYFPFYIRLVTSAMYLGGKKTDLSVLIFFRYEDRRTCFLCLIGKVNDLVLYMQELYKKRDAIGISFFNSK